MKVATFWSLAHVLGGVSVTGTNVRGAGIASRELVSNVSSVDACYISDWLLKDLIEYGAFELRFSYDGDQVEADITVEPDEVGGYFRICDELDKVLVEESFDDVVGEDGTIDVEYQEGASILIDADFYYHFCQALDRKLPLVFRRMYRDGWRRKIYGPRSANDSG